MKTKNNQYQTDVKLILSKISIGNAAAILNAMINKGKKEISIETWFNKG